MVKNFDDVYHVLKKMGYHRVGCKSGAAIFKFVGKKSDVTPLKQTLKVPFTIAQGNKLDKILAHAGFKAYKAREFGKHRRRKKHLSQAYRKAVQQVENATTFATPPPQKF